MTRIIEDQPNVISPGGVSLSRPGSSVINLDTHRRSADLFMVCLRRSMSGSGSAPARLRLDEAGPRLPQGPVAALPMAADRMQHLIDQYMVSLRGQSGQTLTPARRDLCDISYLPGKNDAP